MILSTRPSTTQRRALRVRPRLGTNYLDLYLLHWPVPSSQFSGVVAGFEKLRAAGKIRRWGVSNFNTNQMEALLRVPDGDRCATNQVPYSLNNRSIERDLLPWCTERDIPVMAYSPLGGDNNLVIHDRTVAQIGTEHGCSAAAVALAWVIRNGKVIAIPESGVSAHVKENAVALSLTLTPQEVQTLDKAYPGPSGANLARGAWCCRRSISARAELKCLCSIHLGPKTRTRTHT